MPHMLRNKMYMNPARDARAGFNLVEILIALAIFSIGIAQVMAVFPTAVYSAAENVRSAQARTLARTAIAELEIDLRLAYIRGAVESAPFPYQVDMRGGTGSADDEWAGYFLTVVSHLTPGLKRTSRLIGNDATSFFLNPVPDPGDQPVPDPGDQLKVTRLALPSTLVAPRVGTVDSVSPSTPTVMTAQAAAWDDADLADGRFFLVFTTGRAARRVYVITGSDEAARAITCGAADFVAAGVTQGDEFAILGAPDGAGITQPTPDFGAPGPGKIQTYLPPFARRDDTMNLTYTYAVIINDTYDPDHPAEAIARVDVLVFHGYNQGLSPEQNRRATAHYVHYIGRR